MAALSLNQTPRVLVLGGARSGKSRYAEALAEASGLAPVYVATATAGDGEMVERIAIHRDRRGGDWTTLEEPFDLAGLIAREGSRERVLVVDCLTLWLTNVMLDERDVDAQAAALTASVAASKTPLIMISNEVGQGIVPENRLARRFRDAAGRLHQDIAAVADAVVLVAAGLPLILKPQEG